MKVTGTKHHAAPKRTPKTSRVSGGEGGSTAPARVSSGEGGSTTRVPAARVSSGEGGYTSPVPHQDRDGFSSQASRDIYGGPSAIPWYDSRQQESNPIAAVASFWGHLFGG